MVGPARRLRISLVGAGRDSARPEIFVFAAKFWGTPPGCSCLTGEPAKEDKDDAEGRDAFTILEGNAL